MRTITIEIVGSNDFTVREPDGLGDRHCDKLTWEEMLGQIAELTHPKLGIPRFRMLTEEESAKARESIF